MLYDHEQDEIANLELWDNIFKRKDVKELLQEISEIARDAYWDAMIEELRSGENEGLIKKLLQEYEVDELMLVDTLMNEASQLV